MSAPDWPARVLALRARKLAAEKALRGVMSAFCALIEEGYRADLTPTQLIRETGLARQTVYDMLNGVERESATDYLSDAPDYSAWAGAGEHANRIHRAAEDGHDGPMIEFRAACNAAVAESVAAGTPVDSAVIAYDPEALAAGIVT